MDRGDGTVTFEPDSIRAWSSAVSPVPLTPARPLRQYSDTRDRALRTMAGGEVFRPRLVRRNSASQRH
nr:hypothetical protein [Kibdelosporangium sp. MJ126-NF4]